MAGDHIVLGDIRPPSDDETAVEFPPSSAASQFDTLKSSQRPYDDLEDTAYATVVDLGGAHKQREGNNVDPHPLPSDIEPPKGLKLVLLMLTLVRSPSAQPQGGSGAIPLPAARDLRCDAAPSVLGVTHLVPLAARRRLTPNLLLQQLLVEVIVGLDNTIVATSTATIANDFQRLTDVGWCASGASPVEHPRRRVLTLARKHSQTAPHTCSPALHFSRWPAAPSPSSRRSGSS